MYNMIVQIKSRSRRIKKNKAEWITKHRQTNRQEYIIDAQSVTRHFAAISQVLIFHKAPKEAGGAM